MMTVKQFLLMKYRMWRRGAYPMPDDKVDAICKTMVLYNDAERYTPWYSLPVWCKDCHEVFIGNRNRETDPKKIRWASLKGDRHDMCFWGDGLLKGWVITPEHSRFAEVRLLVDKLLNKPHKTREEMEQDRLGQEFLTAYLKQYG